MLAALGPREIVLTHKDGLLVLANGSYHEAGFHPVELRGRSGRGDTCVGSYAVEADLGGTRGSDALGRGAHEPQARSRRPHPAQPRGRRAADPGALLMRASRRVHCSCSSSPAAPVHARFRRRRSPSSSLFGDSGYHYDYLDPDDEPGPKTYEAVRRDRAARLAQGQAPARRIPPAAVVPGATNRQLHRRERPGGRRQCHASVLRRASRLRVRGHARRQHLSQRRDRRRRRTRRCGAVPQDFPRALRAAGRV